MLIDFETSPDNSKAQTNIFTQMTMKDQPANSLISQDLIDLSTKHSVYQMPPKVETLDKYAQTEELSNVDPKVTAKSLSDIEYPDTTFIKIQHSEFQDDGSQEDRRKILIFVNSADLTVQDENGQQRFQSFEDLIIKLNFMIEEKKFVNLQSQNLIFNIVLTNKELIILN